MEKNRKRSCDVECKQLTKSSSMNHLLEKTAEYVPAKKKYSHLLYPKTDIFGCNQPKGESKQGKRNISMEHIRSDADYSGKRYGNMNEIHFSNIYKDR